MNVNYCCLKTVVLQMNFELTKKRRNKNSKPEPFTFNNQFPVGCVELVGLVNSLTIS